jgi:ABC-type bacteriocin/lantibiotic exporter with double-glycine peptidase domain
MVCGALAELLTLGAVLPLLTLLANPSAIGRYAHLRSFFERAGLEGGTVTFVDCVAGLFCVIVVAAAFIRILLAWASQKYVYRLGYDLGVSLYNRVLYQPYSFHVATDSATVVASIGKVQQLLNQMLLPVLQAMTATLISLFILAGLMMVNTLVAVASILSFGGVYIGISVATRRPLRENSQIISRANTQRVQVVQEGLGGIRDIIIDQTQPVYLRKFMKIDNRLRDAQAANALITAAPRFLIEAMGMVMIAILALILNRGTGGLANALPVLGALAIGAQRLLPLLQQIYTGWTAMMGNKGTLFDLLTLLERPLPQASAQPGRGTPLRFEQRVTIQALSFRYSPALPEVLSDINLDIPKGSRIGLVGKTGSGKSTLVDLIMGLLVPGSGAILIDGKPLEQDRVADWQLHIAHVPQHIYLADATLMENVAFGVAPRDIDEDRVREAVRRAELAEFVEAHADGYRMSVGERGVRLSGGQRQRIGIARALYKNASLLVLDEATSALDDATEGSIIKSIERLGGTVTVIMIAHRVSTLAGCDIVYRMDHGKVVARGSFDEVIGKAA